MKQEELLRAYIEKILNLQDEQLSEEHLRKVAFELGLDENAYLELKNVYQQHLKRGNTFTEHKNWEEAIAEYRHAIDLNPMNTVGLMAQSRAFESFWKESGKNLHREEALYYAKRALKFDPDLKEAAESIGRIQERAEKRTGSLRLLAVVLGGLLIGLSLITYNAIRFSGNPPPEPYTALDAEDAQEAEEQDFSNLEVPIRFKMPADPQFEFVPTVSKLINRKENFSMDVQGRFIVKKGEISKMSVFMSMIMEDSSVWATQKFTALYASVPLRVGDRIPYGGILFEDRPLDKKLAYIEMEVAESTVSKGRESYPASKPIPTVYQGRVQEGIDLLLKLRTYEYQHYSNSSYVYVGVEATNTGEIPLSVVEFKIDLVDIAGNNLFEGKQYAIAPFEPPLEPGGTYVSSRSYDLEDVDWRSVENVEVRVAEARPFKK
ncbi:MAG: hypothetical protein AAFR87_01800 [Bacteroidota bacterium]